MNLDIKLLHKCPELTDYEKDLIRRIDINNETQASVAKHYGKTPSTVSLQHKKALEKFNAWIQNRSKREGDLVERDLDKKVFRLFNQGLPPSKVVEKLGRADYVFRLWREYCKLMQDDWSAALQILDNYGIEGREDSERPVAERVESLCKENFGLSLEKAFIWDLVEKAGFTKGLDKNEDGSASEAVKRLSEYYQAALRVIGQRDETIESLNLASSRKDRQIEALTIENAKLSHLRKYETLTDEEIEQRKQTIQQLDNSIDEKRSQRDLARLDADAMQKICDGLRSKPRETLLYILGQLSMEDGLDLLNEAQWSKLPPNLKQVWKPQTGR